MNREYLAFKAIDTSSFPSLEIVLDLLSNHRPEAKVIKIGHYGSEIFRMRLEMPGPIHKNLDLDLDLLSDIQNSDNKDCFERLRVKIIDL
jgi:hypothetical protein